MGSPRKLQKHVSLGYFEHTFLKGFPKNERGDIGAHMGRKSEKSGDLKNNF